MGGWQGPKGVRYSVGHRAKFAVHHGVKFAVTQGLRMGSLKSPEARCIKLRSRKSVPPHPRARIHSHATLRPRERSRGRTPVGALCTIWNKNGCKHVTENNC